MRAAISLLVLLLSMCGVQTESHGSDASTQLDVSTELKELRDMLVELRGRHVASEADNVAVKQRLVASESKVEALEAENKVLTERLAVSESKVENLEKEIRAAPKVAFSAGLRESGTGYIESGSNGLNVVFKRVITNVGEAYSSTTGFFTAPDRGVYYFRFTVQDVLDSRHMHIRMHKNGEQFMRLYEHDTDGMATYLSSGLALQLEEGDTVNLVLPADRRLYDYSAESRSTFSGFLLFPL